jgi:hypothetical protein
VAPRPPGKPPLQLCSLPTYRPQPRWRHRTVGQIIASRPPLWPAMISPHRQPQTLTPPPPLPPPRVNYCLTSDSSLAPRLALPTRSATAAVPPPLPSPLTVKSESPSPSPSGKWGVTAAHELRLFLFMLCFPSTNWCIGKCCVHACALLYLNSGQKTSVIN